MKEVYYSIDIEADGIIPGKNSMLSIGAVAINMNGDPVDEYYATLKPLPGTSPNKDTEKFWEKYSGAYKRATENARDPELVMRDFANWIKTHGADKNVFVAYPAAFDFGFINHYFLNLVGNNPFAFNVLDIGNLAMGVLGINFNDSRIDKLPSEWQSAIPHTHVAIEDARQQGEIFSAVLKAMKEADAVRKITMHKMEELVETGKVDRATAAALASRIRSFYGTKPIKKIVYR